MRRTRFAVLAATLVSAGALVAPGLATTASAGVVSGACTTSKGVTVVVNYGKYGGTTVRCFSGASSSTDGVEALQGAQFSPDGTAQYGLAFICRINNVPPPSDEDCGKTPPATAYWSYWYASNGGAWTYSNKGATYRDVIVGGFEGWSFHSGSGANTPPTSGNPTRPETPTITLGPAASATRNPTKAGATATTAKPTASTANPSKTATGTPTGTTSSTSTPLAAADAGGPTDSAGAALPGESPGSGQSPWPFVGGAGGIALLLGGSALVGWRRRGGGG